MPEAWAWPGRRVSLFLSGRAGQEEDQRALRAEASFAGEVEVGPEPGAAAAAVVAVVVAVAADLVGFRYPLASKPGA